MADEVDRAAQEVESQIADAVRKVSLKADLPVGEPGECELCGEWSGRLINGACAPCRDKYKLP
jgi:hypothetical protein